MINFLGLENVVKPTKIYKNNSIQGFRQANFASKPDTFERSNSVTSPISFTGKSNRLREYKKLTESLNKTADKAQTSLNRQLATEGWAGKTANAISVLWNSKNRATLVQADIDGYKEQVSTLDNSIKTDKFTDKFKEMFDVNYNHSNISRYNKASKEYEKAFTSDCVAKYVDEKLSKNLEIFNKNSGMLKDLKETRINTFAQSGSVPTYNHTTAKDKIFNDMEKSLVEVLGDKKVLDTILSVNGLNSEKASKEDKYKMYGDLSNYIVEASKTSAKKNLKGKSLDQLKEASDKSYEKAFGTKNDIIKRVDKYNSSQKVGSACVEFVSNVILNTLGPGSVLASCFYSAGKSIAFDVARVKSKDEDRDLDLKAIAVNAGLSGVSGIVNRIIVNTYAGPVASKILGGENQSDSFGAKLVEFVVKEIVSKEGVKLPAYAVEEVVNAVVKNLAGVQAKKGIELSQKELKEAVSVLTESLTNLAIVKNNENEEN